MKITVRAIALCLALAVGAAVLRATQPASPPGSPDASPSTLALAFAVLASTLMVAYKLSRRVSRVRIRSVGTAIVYFLLAGIPLGFMAYGASTGRIRLFGRYGKLNDYSAAVSPVGYWGTFFIYAVISAFALSRALAHLRNGNVP